MTLWHFCWKFQESLHQYKGTQDTFDIWGDWKEWQRDMTWTAKRHRRRHRYSENTFKKSFKILVTFEPFDQRIWIHDIKIPTKKDNYTKTKAKTFRNHPTISLPCNHNLPSLNLVLPPHLPRNPHHTVDSRPSWFFSWRRSGSCRWRLWRGGGWGGEDQLRRQGRPLHRTGICSPHLGKLLWKNFMKLCFSLVSPLLDPVVVTRLSVVFETELPPQNG